MGVLVVAQRIDDRRLDKFVSQVRDICKSPISFKKSIDVNVGHIAWRAAEGAQDIRNAIDAEKMAALIIQGSLRTENCKGTSPIEAVFDGRFAELTEIQFSPVREVKHQNQGIRIVVREGASKHIVVTVHPLSLPNDELMSLPEVTHDIW